MNFDVAELSVALIDFFTILVPKCPLPEASQSMHHSANHEITDKKPGVRRLSGSPASTSLSCPEHLSTVITNAEVPRQSRLPLRLSLSVGGALTEQLTVEDCIDLVFPSLPGCRSFAPSRLPPWEVPVHLGPHFRNS
jgi:hypothetical protein